MDDRNTHTATRNIGTRTIKVTVERGTWDERISLDGWDTGSIKTHLINRTKIALCDGDKVLAYGSTLDPLPKRHTQLDQAIKAGCVGIVGNGWFVKPETAELIKDALDEANAAAPKTARQLEIEAAEDAEAARIEAWRNSPEGKADIEAMERHERLMREMDRADSDY